MSLFNQQEATKIMENINASFSFEGMELSDEEKQRSIDILSGKTSYEKEKEEILKKYRG